MPGAERAYAEALALRAAELKGDHATAAAYADELADELRAYVGDPASVAAVRAHLLAVAASRDEAAEDLEEARRLLAARGSSPAG